jgi:hypothetical protein
MEFRYSKSTVALFRWLMPCPAIFFSAVYVLTRHSRSALPFDAYLFLLMAATVVCALIYASMVRGCVRVTHSDIHIQELFSARNIPFSEISEVHLLRGGKGPPVLKLLGRSDKTLATIGGSLENFGSLTALIKERATAAGAPYRCRDLWGRWTSG